jgi:hypothetical protein
MPMETMMPSTTLEPTLIMRYNLLKHQAVTVPSVRRGLALGR